MYFLKNYIKNNYALLQDLQAYHLLSVKNEELFKKKISLFIIKMLLMRLHSGFNHI